MRRLIPVLAIGLTACSAPPPVINVTINMPAPVEAKSEPKIESTGMPTAINHPMPADRKWGDVLTWRLDGEVYQVQVCRSRAGLGYEGCFSYGPSFSEGMKCLANQRQAEVDFPGEEYICTLVYRSDLERPLGLPIDQT